MEPPPDPEYRRDPVTGRWVIIAPARAGRPLTLPHSAPVRRRDSADPVGCPLCEGAERHTPAEVYAVGPPDRRPNGPGWRLRVVPNKFPAVRPIPDPVFDAAGPALFDALPGFGEHELVVECPDHEVSPTDLTAAELAAVFVAYRERLLALSQNPLLAYATVFKNVGAEAGASLAHLHSQIVATPVVPEAVRAELDGAARYHGRFGRCVFCDVVREELRAGERVVGRTARFVAVCPFAPRFGHEVWVLPAAHHVRYERVTDDAAAELAGLMRRLVGAVDRVLGEPAYNYYLHTAPLRSDPLPHYHWHVELIPRTARQAGFEWGSGCFINAVRPEAAAADLRAALPPA